MEKVMKIENNLKTLIVYASKYGTTKDCANQLASLINGEVQNCNVERDAVTDLKQFDVIIVGGSIYVGKIQKKITSFCEQNKTLLLSKKLGLFICRGNQDNNDEAVFTANFPHLASHVVVKSCFGGEFRNEKMSFIHRQIVKVVTKKSEQPLPNISLENIKKFAESMQHFEG